MGRLRRGGSAGAAFVALVMAAGVRSLTGVLLIPLNEEFGRSPTGTASWARRHR